MNIRNRKENSPDIFVEEILLAFMHFLVARVLPCLVPEDATVF